MTKTIGSKKNARLISRVMAGKKALPDTWKFLGEGVSRAAYLAPDGYVYKVELLNWHYDDANRIEYDALRERSKTIFKHFRLPKANLIEVDGKNVMVMEHVNGRPWALSRKAQIEALQAGINDAHAYNVLKVPSDKPVIIDVADICEEAYLEEAECYNCWGSLTEATRDQPLCKCRGKYWND